MKKGRKTNVTGTQLERAVQTVLLEKGFEIEMYRKWEKDPKKYGKELLLKNMKKILFLSIIIIAFSCGQKNEKKRIAEVSCGQCKFGLTSQKGCDLAIKIDDKAYFVDGAHIDDFGDAHDVETGFCEVVRKAEVVGAVEEGRFRIWAEHVGANTATQRIKHYIENSLNEKSSVQLKANKLANKLVPVTLGLAGVSYVFAKDFERVASILQADYSCALKLATPVAFKSTISKAGHNGIMIKGAKSIEALSSADTFIFDKFFNNQFTNCCLLNSGSGGIISFCWFSITSNKLSMTSLSAW